MGTAPATTAAAGGGGGIDYMALVRKYGPVAAQIISAYIASRVGRNETAAAMQRSPEELLALEGAQGAAGQSMQRGDDLFNAGAQLTGQGLGYLQGPANFYQTLLSGNRAAMSNVTGPAVAQISETYRGASRGLEHSGTRGAARDVQRGELNRQRAGQIAGLTAGVQPAAAAGLSGLGSQALGAAAPLYGAGAGLYGASGNIYRGLLNDANSNRRYGREEGQGASEEMSKLLRDILEAATRKDAPTTPTTPAPGGGTPTTPTTGGPPISTVPPTPPPAVPPGPATPGTPTVTPLRAPTGRVPSWGSGSPFGVPPNSPFSTAPPTNRWRF